MTNELLETAAIADAAEEYAAKAQAAAHQSRRRRTAAEHAAAAEMDGAAPGGAAGAGDAEPPRGTAAKWAERAHWAMVVFNTHAAKKIAPLDLESTVWFADAEKRIAEAVRAAQDAENQAEMDAEQAADPEYGKTRVAERRKAHEQVEGLTSGRTKFDGRYRAGSGGVRPGGSSGEPDAAKAGAETDEGRKPARRKRGGGGAPRLTNKQRQFLGDFHQHTEEGVLVAQSSVNLPKYQFDLRQPRALIAKGLIYEHPGVRNMWSLTPEGEIESRKAAPEGWRERDKKAAEYAQRRGRRTAETPEDRTTNDRTAAAQTTGNEDRG